MNSASTTSSKKSRVLVIGDIILDRYFEGTADRISPEAPVPILHHLSTHSTLGGAANVACSIATMGADVSLIGLVGDDAEGSKVLESFKEFNQRHSSQSGVGSIEIDGVLKRKTCPTIVKTRLVTKQHQLARIDREEIHALEANIEEQVIKALSEKVRDCETIVVSDYAKGCISRNVIKAVVDKALENGKEVIVDPKQKDLSFYAGATLLTPNKSELERYWCSPLDNEQSIEQALIKTSKATTSSVLVTRAQEGATLLTEGKFTTIPAQYVDVADVSGAGDTLVATLAVFRSEGFDWETAIIKAVDAATKSVKHNGVVQVFRKELQEYLDTPKASLVAPIFKAEQQDELLKVYEGWKQSGQRIVMTNGCFDLFHKGHLSSLIKAREFGDKLVVVLNSDASVKAAKGQQRPIVEEGARAEILAALKCVDLVIIFNQETPEDLIKLFKPNVLVKGLDYQLDQIAGADFVQSYGGRVERIALEEGWSTSSIIRKIKDA